MALNASSMRLDIPAKSASSPAFQYAWYASVQENAMDYSSPQVSGWNIIQNIANLLHELY